MIDELVDAVKCPRDYFEIECIKSVAIRDGKIADVYPFVEVAWFDRGQEVQDTVAKIITDNIRENLNIESMDLAFTVFEKENVNHHKIYNIYAKNNVFFYVSRETLCGMIKIKVL